VFHGLFRVPPADSVCKRDINFWYSGEPVMVATGTTVRLWKAIAKDLLEV